MNFIKKILGKNYYKLTNFYSKIIPFWIVKKLKNKTAPMNLRYKFILNLAKQNNIKTFIETGTYLGETINSVKDYFDEIYSFEISKELVDLANKRFNKCKNIKIIIGDSGEKMPELLKNINTKIIFWLDGHYSKDFLFSDKSQEYNKNESPIKKELYNIFLNRNKKVEDLILIDDAHEFDGTRGYPTILELENIINNYNDNYKIKKFYNIIFILPKNQFLKI